jgi:HEPN domain-containing protein
MSSEEQAEAYMEEARLTFQSARTIMEKAGETEDMWAQVVKNAYDAIEQAVSAAIASRGESIPRKHPAKITKFLDLFDVGEETEEKLLYWLRRRSDSQYVDIRGDEINIPHEEFDEEDAQEILEDAEAVIAEVEALK